MKGARLLLFFTVAAGAAMGAGALGCSREGTAYRCQCTFLTDFDDPSGVTVEICAATPREAELVGRECGQSSAPAPVDKCTCAPDAHRPGPCKVGCR